MLLLLLLLLLPVLVVVVLVLVLLEGSLQLMRPVFVASKRKQIGYGRPRQPENAVDRSSARSMCKTAELKTRTRSSCYARFLETRVILTHPP